jgi:hypothetical protein
VGEINMKDGQTISFSIAEAYCKKCGKKEMYNGNSPFSMPHKCRFCDGEMTTKQREEFLKIFEINLDKIDLDKIKKQIKITKKKESVLIKKEKPIIKILEELKDNFADLNQYSGASVKLIIDEIIKKEVKNK